MTVSSKTIKRLPVGGGGGQGDQLNKCVVEMIKAQRGEGNWTDKKLPAAPPKRPVSPKPTPGSPSARAVKSSAPSATKAPIKRLPLGSSGTQRGQGDQLNKCVVEMIKAQRGEGNWTDKQLPSAAPPPKKKATTPVSPRGSVPMTSLALNHAARLKRERNRVSKAAAENQDTSGDAKRPKAVRKAKTHGVLNMPAYRPIDGQPDPFDADEDIDLPSPTTTRPAPAPRASPPRPTPAPVAPAPVAAPAPSGTKSAPPPPAAGIKKLEPSVSSQPAAPQPASSPATKPATKSETKSATKPAAEKPQPQGTTQTAEEAQQQAAVPPPAGMMGGTVMKKGPKKAKHRSPLVGTVERKADGLPKDPKVREVELLKPATLTRDEFGVALEKLPGAKTRFGGDAEKSRLDRNDLPEVGVDAPPPAVAKAMEKIEKKEPEKKEKEKEAPKEKKPVKAAPKKKAGGKKVNKARSAGSIYIAEDSDAKKAAAKKISGTGAGGKWGEWDFGGDPEYNSPDDSDEGSDGCSDVHRSHHHHHHKEEEPNSKLEAPTNKNILAPTVMRKGKDKTAKDSDSDSDSDSTDGGSPGMGEKKKRESAEVVAVEEGDFEILLSPPTFRKDEEPGEMNEDLDEENLLGQPLEKKGRPFDLDCTLPPRMAPNYPHWD